MDTVVVLSGGQLGGTEVAESQFTQLGPYKFYVSNDGYQYRLIDEFIEDNKKQAVFVAKVF